MKLKKATALALCGAMCLASVPLATYSQITVSSTVYAEEITPLEPELINGYYQIENIENLYWFIGNYTNATTCNAILMNDIVVNQNVISNGALNTDSDTYTEWSAKSSAFNGIFDGNNHTISGLYFNDVNRGSASDPIGFIGKCKNGTIKNLTIKDSYFSAGGFIGAICGNISGSSGTIENCSVINSIICAPESCTTIGGICGANSASGTIQNCFTYDTKTIKGESTSYAIVGSTNSSSTNCFAWNSTNESNFKSGEIAYNLTHDADGKLLSDTPWGQDLSTDSYPILGKNAEYPVYQVTSCDGVSTAYSNTDGPLAHNFANGKCETCNLEITGYSMTLEGTISIHLAFSDTWNTSDTWTTQYMNPTTNAVQSIPLTQNSSNVATFDVPIRYLNDTDISICCGETTVKTFTGNELLEAYQTNAATNTDTALVNLAKSLQNFSAVSDAYFSRETVEEVQNVTVNSENDAVVSGTMPEGISYYGSSLLLKSTTSIRHYFEATDISTYTFTVNGTTCTPVKYDTTDDTNNYYYIEISNIASSNLANKYTLEVTDGTDTYTLQYSALSYANKVIGNSESDSNLVNLCKSMYAYSDASQAYNNSKA